MKKMNNKANIYLATGLILTAIAIVLHRGHHATDFVKGCIQGAGVVSVIAGLFLYVRTGSRPKEGTGDL